eukprot:scaffold60808_cov66-Phaeocystis_antarctica.AAC.6
MPGAVGRKLMRRGGTCRAPGCCSPSKDVAGPRSLQILFHYEFSRAPERQGVIETPAPSCDACVALDGFVHRRRFAYRSCQLAAAQPGCPSLDPHATCSEARPRGLATLQLVSHFLRPSVPLLCARETYARVFSHLLYLNPTIDMTCYEL